MQKTISVDKKEKRIIISFPPAIWAMIMIFLAATIAICFINDYYNQEKSISDIARLQVTMTTALDLDDSLDLSLDIPAAYIDWGDGNPVLSVAECNSEDSDIAHWYHYGVIKGDTVRIYSDVPIKLFSCMGVDVTALDVSEASDLEFLDCSLNDALKKIDVSKNSKLKSLSCDTCALTVLDISDNVGLTFLSCEENKLTKLDVSKNLKLQDLHCAYNELNTLDISKNNALKTLWCSYNNLSGIDVSKNSELEELSCYDNDLSVLDLTKNLKLTDLICISNKLSDLDVSKNTALTYLDVGDNKLSSLDISQNTELMDLSCYSNQLTKLDLSHNTKLECLSCEYNKLTELDVSKNKNLHTLNCTQNNLSDFDISGIDNLSYIYISHSNIKFSNLKCNKAQLELLAGENIYVSIASAINYGESIDLSSEYEINGSKTLYKWYEYNSAAVSSSDILIPVEPDKSEDGVFTFGEEFVGHRLYCVMTNDEFDGVRLQTTIVEITSGSVQDDNDLSWFDTVYIIYIVYGVIVVVVLFINNMKKKSKEKKNNK